jgi:AAHS family 4-hydroxybenzoate transporter-like MFS transporter
METRGSEGRLNVSDVIDQSRLRAFQVGVLALCTLCMTVDGFDVQAMGYVAPAVIAEWHISKASLGPVFGAGLLGMLLGSLLFGWAADKLGRRPVLVAASGFLAVTMFLTGRADSVGELLMLRTLTGFALGAIVPNAVALAGEYSPGHLRVSVMMVVSSGFIVGGAIGGALAAAVIPTLGWRAVFYIGALAPALMGTAMLAWLPESLQFLVLRNGKEAQVGRWLKRIDASLPTEGSLRFLVNERPRRGLPFVNLFRDGAAAATSLLWIMNFMNMLCGYFLSAWLPVIMSGAGHATSYAVLAGTAFWSGGLVGNWLLGFIVDRRGFGAVLAPAFAVAAASIVAVSQVYGVLTLAFVAIGVTGFCVLGGQSALNALAATVYPTTMRSTGLGWAIGAGRLGAIVGPVLGGELMRHGWSTGDLLLAAALPPVLAMAASLAFWKTVKAGQGAAELTKGRELLHPEI